VSLEKKPALRDRRGVTTRLGLGGNENALIQLNTDIAASFRALPERRTATHWPASSGSNGRTHTNGRSASYLAGACTTPKLQLRRFTFAFAPRFRHAGGISFIKTERNSVGCAVFFTSISKVRRRFMPKEAHTKAAEHYETAAKSHRTAAEHYGKGDTQRHVRNRARRRHSKAAHEQSGTAHSKSNSAK
jgi:hypothetical protein